MAVVKENVALQSFKAEYSLHRSLNATVALYNNYPFGINTKFELKNIATTSYNNGI